MKLLIFLSIFFCYLLNLHAQTPEINKLKDQIEKTIYSNPDSTKYYMFRLLEHSSKLHDTVIGKTYSHIGIQYNKLAVSDSAEFYMKKALDYTGEYPKVHGEMYLNIATNYRIGARYNESLAACEKAIEMFEKANTQRGRGRAYGEMASNYNYMKNSEKALEYLKKAIAILTNVKDERELNIVKQKLANLYFNNGDYAFARDLFEEVLPSFEKLKGTNYYVTLLSYSDCLIQLKIKYKEAEKSLNEVINAFREMNQLEYKLLAVTSLAKLYVATGRTEEAQVTFKEAYDGLYKLNSPRFLETSVSYLTFLNDQKQYTTALNLVAKVKATVKTKRLKMNADNEIAFLKQAVSTYSQKGMVQNSLASFERIDFLKDSVNEVLNLAKAFELQESYQNDLQLEKNFVLTKNNELLVENNSKKDKILMLSILSFVLILAIGIVLFWSYRRKLKLQHELVASLENSKEVLEEKNKLASELRIERENTIANKEQELIEVTLEISDIQKKIKELVDHRENPENSMELAAQLNGLLSQNNYWKYFKGKFVEVHPAFAVQLTEMFPNLSENEVAFCCMLKLQLSIDEIASLMGIRKEQVESKKANLRRKIGMGDDLLGFEKFIDHLE